MKGRATSYTDYYKGTSSKPPGANKEDDEDEEYGDTGHLGASLTKDMKKNKKLTPLQEARKLALKRRLNKKVG